MIGCYVTGALPRPKELIQVTQAYSRGRTNECELERAFEKATLQAVNAQRSVKFNYVTDGMLKWQDLLRPFTENLGGVKIGSLTRWFDNNIFYRKPIIVEDIWRKRDVIKETTYIRCLPKDSAWKTILPAPYTFVQLAENQYYTDKTEFMFKYAEILREEIRGLSKLGFEYVQLSDPALVYNPTGISVTSDELDIVRETLEVAVEGIPIRSCLQTFFGDFAQILPEALDFPVDDLGIDLYTTDFYGLKEHRFEKGIALGLVDSRSSLAEDKDELTSVARDLIKSICPSETYEVFICPNCDLEFLPWRRAEKKIEVVQNVVSRLRENFYE